MPKLSDAQKQGIMRECQIHGMTLDGEHATVRGWRNDFATVSSERVDVEYSWLTLHRMHLDTVSIRSIECRS